MRAGRGDLGEEGPALSRCRLRVHSGRLQGLGGIWKGLLQDHLLGLGGYLDGIHRATCRGCVDTSFPQRSLGGFSAKGQQTLWVLERSYALLPSLHLGVILKAAHHLKALSDNSKEYLGAALQKGEEEFWGLYPLFSCLLSEYHGKLAALASSADLDPWKGKAGVVRLS